MTAVIHPASTADDTIEASSKKRRWLSVRTVAGIGVAGTLFDALASWIIIGNLGFALEMNGIWLTLSELFGFGGAMVVRSIYGVALFGGVYYIATKSKNPRNRRTATIGINVGAAVLAALATYHVWGIFYYFS